MTGTGKETGSGARFKLSDVGLTVVSSISFGTSARRKRAMSGRRVDRRRTMIVRRNVRVTAVAIGRY